MINTPSVNSRQKTYQIIFSGLVILLCGIYFLDFFTPLRLTHDTIRYFRTEEWMEKGFPSGDNAAKDFLPYGYSSLLWLLSRLHWLHPFMLAFINAMYLFGALWFVTNIFSGAIGFHQLAFFMMLSWLALKFVITPLSEMQFIFFSAGALYFYHIYRLYYCVRYILFGLIFFIAAILTRTVGIVILLAVVFNLLLESRKQINVQIRKNWKWVIGVIAGFTILIYFPEELRIIDYLKYFFKLIKHYGIGVFIRGIPLHIRDWSELFINTPSSKIKFLPQSVRDGIFILAGIFFFSILFYFIFNKKIKTPSIVKYYLLVYIIVILNWPFFDSRFWLPILPFVLAILLQEIGSTVISKMFVIISRATYIGMGIFALAYYTYTSFNREALARKQDAGLWRNEYEIHFFGRILNDTATQKKTEVIQLLNKIDKPLIHF